MCCPPEIHLDVCGAVEAGPVVLYNLSALWRGVCVQSIRPCCGKQVVAGSE